ncbi:MAG TPA: TRL-like family protein [Smithellaceae bacterium]|nr:TRL-like family protein [Smithellaceae bacterium]
MMRTLRLAVVLGAALILTGCAMLVPMGTVYTDVKLPLAATGNGAVSPKTGEASCVSILGVVATGDCSIEAAKKNGGIAKVNSVDWKVNNILGIYGTYKVVVSGE